MLTNNTAHHEPHYIHPTRPQFNAYSGKQGGLAAFPASKPIQHNFDWSNLRPPVSKPSESAARANRPSIVYRNSKECKPFLAMLHDFEGEQFGEDFSSDSSHYEHWFNAETFFCAAAFAEETLGQVKVLSVLSMIFVTEESALDFIVGKIDENALEPYRAGDPMPPVIYFSSLAATNFSSLIPLYKLLLKDIASYKEKNSIAPNWGFSIAATPSGHKYLEHSGFKNIGQKNFLNKYDIVTINKNTAECKIWKSIFKYSGRSKMEARKEISAPLSAGEGLVMGLS